MMEEVKGLSLSVCAACQSLDLVVEEDQGSPKERSHVLSSNIVTQLGKEKI